MWVFRYEEGYGRNGNCPDGTCEIPGTSTPILRTIVQMEPLSIPVRASSIRNLLLMQAPFNQQQQSSTANRFLKSPPSLRLLQRRLPEKRPPRKQRHPRAKPPLRPKPPEERTSRAGSAISQHMVLNQYYIENSRTTWNVLLRYD